MIDPDELAQDILALAQDAGKDYEYDTREVLQRTLERWATTIHGMQQQIDDLGAEVSRLRAALRDKKDRWE